MDTKKRLFIDMDGTLAEYRTFEAMEQYYQKGYFESLKPLKNVVEAIRIVANTCPQIELYTLSACPEGSLAPQEKNQWLNINLPEIDMENRIYTIIGESKRNHIPNGINKNDYLLDDYPHNLHDWAKEGSGIKLFNGLNANVEKWSGSCISYKNSPKHIAQALIDIILKDKVIIDEMDEIQIKNEEKGQSLYIERNELTEIINKYFRNDFIDIDDFRRNYTSSDWDFVNRISSTARVETHTSSKQYAFECATIQKKLDNTLSIVTESLSNQRKDLAEKEVYFALENQSTQDTLSIIVSLEDNFNAWHDYFVKTIMDLEKMTKNFFTRYEAASKGNDFSNVSLHKDSTYLTSKIHKVKDVCEKIYQQDKQHLKKWKEEIKKQGFEQQTDTNKSEIVSSHPVSRYTQRNKSIGDVVLDDETSISVPGTLSDNDIIDLS